MGKQKKSDRFSDGRVRRVDGHLRAWNLSAYFLEKVIHVEKMHGTTYIVDGSYEGSETLPSKLKRILANQEKSDDDE